MPSAMPRAGNKPLIGLTLVSAVVMMVTLYLIFVLAPIEQRMGIVYKILFFHAPSAYAMYIGFGLCGLFSLLYLAKGEQRWDALAVAAGEVGVIFCLIMLITGPLWARKAWGVYWTWDPRLTSTLLAGLIYLAWWVLRAFASEGEVERRFAAGLAIFGTLDLVIIHYSVQLWRGTHPTVITERGGGLSPAMVPALVSGFVVMTLVAALLIWLRFRIEQMRIRQRTLELELVERGVLEDD